MVPIVAAGEIGSCSDLTQSSPTILIEAIEELADVDLERKGERVERGQPWVGWPESIPASGRASGLNELDMVLRYSGSKGKRLLCQSASSPQPAQPHAQLLCVLCPCVLFDEHFHAVSMGGPSSTTTKYHW